MTLRQIIPYLLLQVRHADAIDSQSIVNDMVKRYALTHHASGTSARNMVLNKHSAPHPHITEKKSV